MTQEEKARRYDEAIKRAQAKMEEAKVFDYDDEQTAHTIRLTTTDIFPELKESEDESIRKWIKKELESKYVVGNTVNNVMADKALAWLEKQGEQKPKRIVSAEAKEAMYDKPAWSEEDESMLYGVMETEQYMLDVVNGIEKFDVGNGAIRKACTEELNWLKFLKDRVQPQPKQEWSEEDRDFIEELISHFRNHIASCSVDSERYKNYIIPKLKSIRPQKQWKPTEEHLQGMRRAICKADKGSDAERDLKDLYEQLKAL